MQAAPSVTGAHATSTARVRTARNAQPTNGRPKEPRRFHRPRRSASSSPLASVQLEPAPTRIERQCVRKLIAAAEAVRKFPFEGLASAGANGHVLVSREAIADHLQGCGACQLEAFEQALALVTERVSVAFQAQEGWLDGVRAGLVALLEFFDEEPALARYLVVRSAQAGEAVLEGRREVLDRIALLLDDERAPARGDPPPLTAQAVASGALGVLHARLSQPHDGALVELAAPLMSFTVMPFLGVRAARRELARPLGGATPTHPVVPLDLLQDPSGRLNPRAVSVLTVIGAEPGLNNREVASHAGVKDDGHSSRLLARLERLGLIENTRTGARSGRRAPRSLQPPGGRAGRDIRPGPDLQAAGAAEAPRDLPRQLPSRLTTLQKACLAATFEANPASCPPQSIVGHATVSTPLLPVPLTGPAYFVSHGGEAFPSLTMVLQGYGVTVDLVGTTFISKAGITSTTFQTVPDVPFSTFELTLPQGPDSVLAANLPAKDNYNFCGQKLLMPTQITGQNGAEIKQNTPITVSGCPKAVTRQQRLAKALKACHRRRRGERAGCERAARRKYAVVMKRK